jgi:DNA-binding MarR family transcriptional regulator
MNDDVTLAADIMALAGFLRRLFESVRENQQISATHFFVLSTLAQRGTLKMAELTALLDMAKGNLTYHIDRLEIAGLVRRMPSPEDRRITYLQLTQAGNAQYDSVVGELRARLERLADRIPANELTAIQAGLALLMSHAELLELP